MRKIALAASLAFALKEKQAELTLEPLGSLSCDGVSGHWPDTCC